MKKVFYLIFFVGGFSNFIFADTDKTPVSQTELNTLFEAIRKSDEQTIRGLIGSKKKLINTQDEHGNSALHIAAKESTPNMIKLLLLLGADPNIKNNNQKKPIEVATERNKPYAAGGDPLHWAVYEQNIPAIKHMLKGYININAKNIIGFTPLVYAVLTDKMPIVELLVNSGADVNARDQIKATPMLYAAFDSSKEILEFLIRNGSKNVFDKNGYNALFYAVIGDKPKNVDYLLSLPGTKVNIKDNAGLTPLHWAVINRHYNIAETLLDNFADINVISKEFETPLFQAAHNGDIAMVKLLLKKGANVNAFYTFPPLKEAIRRYNAIKNKKEKGNLQDYFEIIKELINHGASIYSRKGYGKTSRQLLEEYKLPEIQELIEKRSQKELIKTLD